MVQRTPKSPRSHKGEKVLPSGIIIRKRAGLERLKRPRFGHERDSATRRVRLSTKSHNVAGKAQLMGPAMLLEKKLFPLAGSLTGSETLEKRGANNSALERDTLYYVPLGGLEEIGRNCMFFEYNDDIVIIDMGIQFPEEETPGVDWIIPNISYLEKKKHKVRALIITHAHYDHFGAVPYVLQKLGNPIIYGTKMVRGILEKRLQEMPNVPKMRFQEIKNHDRVKISPHFSAEFFGVSHTVPDTTGVALETPAGTLVHFADFRLDYDEADTVHNLHEFERLGQKGVHSLLIDSTNADFGGHSKSEKIVIQNLEKLIKEASGRVLLSTFASMIERLAEIIEIGERSSRKVMINGRSMKENLEIAKQLGYLKYKKDTIVPVESLNKYRDNEVLILSTGAQGQENAGLMRIVNGEHKYIRIKEGDTVILSSSVIPGNERAVQNLKDNFARQGATVHTNADLDIHSSGHAPGPDLALVAKLCKPKFIIPIHAHFYKRAANIQNMKAIGITKERVILPDNGQIIKIEPEKITITNKTVNSHYILVDGLGIGDVEAVVLRDRKLLADEGMVVIITTLSRKSGRLLKNPDIISRGFIYLKEHGRLIDDLRAKIRSIVGQTLRAKAPEPEYVKALIRDQVGLLIYKKTQRRPMILPVMIEI